MAKIIELTQSPLIIDSDTDDSMKQKYLNSVQIWPLTQNTSPKKIFKDPQMQCQECGKHFKTRDQLGDHVLYHKSLERLTCVQCDEKITRKSLKKHLKSVHNMEIDKRATWIQGNVKEFQCEDCGRQCKNQKQYSSHRYYHKYVLDGPQTICVKCDLDVPERLLAQHIRRVHNKK